MHNRCLSMTTLLGAILVMAGCGSSEAPRSTYNPEGSAKTFGDMLGQFIHVRSMPPASLDDAISARQTVVVGNVVDLVEGRRLVLGDGTDPQFYAQYYNVVIRPTAVVKGNASTRADVHVEFIWPRDLSAAELSEALPRGARAIVLGDRSEGAGGGATLLSVPGYGLVFETAKGATALPFEHDATVAEAVPGAKNSFAELHAAIASR